MIAPWVGLVLGAAGGMAIVGAPGESASPLPLRSWVLRRVGEPDRPSRRAGGRNGDEPGVRPWP